MVQRQVGRSWPWLIHVWHDSSCVQWFIFWPLRVTSFPPTSLLYLCVISCHTWSRHPRLHIIKQKKSVKEVTQVHKSSVAESCGFTVEDPTRRFACLILCALMCSPRNAEARNVAWKWRKTKSQSERQSFFFLANAQTQTMKKKDLIFTCTCYRNPYQLLNRNGRTPRKGWRRPIGCLIWFFWLLLLETVV